MSDTPDFPDGDIAALLAAQIETRFGLALAELTLAVNAAPRAHTSATYAVHAYGLLTEAQSALETAEDALVAELQTAAGDVLDDPVMDLAHQVYEAVELRDARAAALRALLETPANQARASTRPVTRLTTTLPTAVPTQPARIMGSAR
ncbi:hypothetical protein ACWGI1_00080 [Streptomyces sp. NPDC054835]|uniref:hypothetical protein n=1 Tax=Streptomyces exfoliatus TaxID=1905 RepID=UPI000467C8FF|nr:hypothetical protein [Streptomyces exfoliatus]